MSKEDLYLLDKLLCIVEYSNIKPIICFTKTDLLDDRTYFEDIKNYYKKIGYEVYLNTELDKIKKAVNEFLEN